MLDPLDVPAGIGDPCLLEEEALETDRLGRSPEAGVWTASAAPEKPRKGEWNLNCDPGLEREGLADLGIPSGTKALGGI